MDIIHNSRDTLPMSLVLNHKLLSPRPIQYPLNILIFPHPPLYYLRQDSHHIYSSVLL